jgi:hypothetical protein
MTHRDRNLLDVAHEAPCFLRLTDNGCSNDPSVPCHDDQLSSGRGYGHKSHDCLAVPGCPVCHALFTRQHLGRERYTEVHASAFKAYQVWLWENRKVMVA